jgi:hypothetical protein
MKPNFYNFVGFLAFAVIAGVLYGYGYYVGSDNNGSVHLPTSQDSTPLAVQAQANPFIAKEYEAPTGTPRVATFPVPVNGVKSSYVPDEPITRRDTGLYSAEELQQLAEHEEKVLKSSELKDLIEYAHANYDIPTMKEHFYQCARTRKERLMGADCSGLI